MSAKSLALASALGLAMLGLSGRPESPDNKSIEPLRAFGVDTMSIGYLIEEDTPMIWRGPMATSAMTQLFNDTLWDDLDFLRRTIPDCRAISRTDDELSIVCLQDRIPQDVQSDGGWSCFKFQGPFAFDETGVVLSVIEPLSTNGIGIFVVSTFDGDHMLVKSSDLEKARGLLENAGHALF